VTIIEIFKLFGSIFLNDEDVNKKLTGVDKKAAGVGETLGKMVGTAAKWGAAIGAAAVAAGTALFKFAENTSNVASEINDMSERTGLNTDRLQELKYATGQVGVEFSSLTTATKGLTNYLADAAAGGKLQTDTFKKLGVELKNTDGTLRKMDDVFPEVINRLADMTDITQRNAIASDIFGKSATELVPLLNQGSAGIKALSDKARELGIVMSGEDIKAGDEFGDTLDSVKAAAGGVLNQIGSFLIPIFQKLANWILSNMPQIRETIKNVFDNIGKTVQTAKNIFNAILPVIAGVTAGIVAFKVATIGAMVIKNLGVLVSTLTIVWKAYQSGMNLATIAQVGFNNSLKVNPILLVATAVGVLVTAIVYFTNKTKQAVDELKQKMIDLYTAERDAAIAAINETTELRIKGIDERRSAEDVAHNNRLADIQKEYDKEKAALQKDLQERKSALDQAHDEEIQRIQDEYGVFEEKAKSKTAVIQEETDKQKGVVDEVLALSEDAAQAEGDAFVKTYDEILNKAQEIHDEKIAMYEQEYLVAIGLINGNLEVTVKALQDEIDGIRNKTAEEERLAEETADKQKIIDLQSAVDSADNDEDRKRANEELANEINRQNREKELANRDIQIESLRTQIDTAIEKANEEKASALEILRTKIAEQQVEIQKDTDYKIAEIQRERIEKETAENAKYEAASKSLDDEKEKLDNWIEEEYKPALQRKLDMAMIIENERHEQIMSDLVIEAAQLQINENLRIKAVEATAQENISAERAKSLTGNINYHDLSGFIIYTATTGERYAWKGTAPPTEEEKLAWIRSIEGFAEGTDNASPGWHEVGEEGPEFVKFKGGETVIPNNEIGSAGGKVINVTINNPVLLDNRMIDKLGQGLVDALRAKGLLTT
jgi:phage-related tail protein